MNDVFPIIAALAAVLFAVQLLASIFNPSLESKLRSLLICDIILTLGIPAMNVWEHYYPVEHPDLSPELQQIKQRYAALFVTPGSTVVCIILLLVVIASWLLVYRRSRFAPRVFLLRVFITFLATISLGPAIIGPWDAALCYLQVVIEGALLALVCITLAQTTDSDPLKRTATEQ